MYCPNCSQAVSEEPIRFCSKCGFDLKAVRQVFETYEIEIKNPNRRKGIKQGALLILSSIVLFPAFVFLSAMFPPDDKLVESSPSSTAFEQIGLTIIWTLVLAGIARILYALVFERNSFSSEIEGNTSGSQLKSGEIKGELPPEQSVPASDFGRWKTSEDLFEPIYNKPKISGELK